MFKKAAIAVLNSHLEATAALKDWQASGLEMRKLSIIGKDYLTIDPARDYYNAVDCMNYWDKPGTFWGPLWGSTALVAALHSIGLPRNKIVSFEAAIKQGNFVLIVHGNADDICKASDLLTSGGQKVNVYASKERLQELPVLR